MAPIDRLIGCALVAIASAAPMPAAAERFEFRWNYKWSWGFLEHETGIADSDPSPTRAVYEGAIRGFEFSGHAPADNRTFSGRGGGDLIVEAEPPDQAGCGVVGGPECIGRRFIFELGRARPDDPAEYVMTATAPYQGTWLDLKGEWGLGGPDEGNGLWGLVTNNLDDRTYGTMSAYFWTSHARVAGPVPEPATLALAAVGLLGVLVQVRRRR